MKRISESINEALRAADEKKIFKKLEELESTSFKTDHIKEILEILNAGETKDDFELANIILFTPFEEVYGLRDPSQEGRVIWKNRKFLFAHYKREEHNRATASDYIKHEYRITIDGKTVAYDSSSPGKYGTTSKDAKINARIDALWYELCKYHGRLK